MSDVKFTLLENSTHYAVGTTDLRRYINRPLLAAGCTMFICHQGQAIVTINFQKRLIKAGDVAFLFSDMTLIAVRRSHDFSAFYCAISSELLGEVTYNISWGFYEYLNFNPICPTTIEQFAQLKLWQEQVSWFVAQDAPGQQYMFMRNSIQNLFFGVDREIKRDPEILAQSQRKDRAWALMNHFFRLLTEHCREQRSVNFYAEKLNITPYYLYKITSKIMKLSPKQLIDEQIVVEIKMYLNCTDMSVKQIAEALCFDDASYMCRFFRRYTGKSLTEYKSDSI